MKTLKVKQSQKKIGVFESYADCLIILNKRIQTYGDIFEVVNTNSEQEEIYNTYKSRLQEGYNAISVDCAGDSSVGIGGWNCIMELPYTIKQNEIEFQEQTLADAKKMYENISDERCSVGFCSVGIVVKNQPCWLSYEHGTTPVLQPLKRKRYSYSEVKNSYYYILCSTLEQAKKLLNERDIQTYLKSAKQYKPVAFLMVDGGTVEETVEVALSAKYADDLNKISIRFEDINFPTKNDE